jgi:hypothetical protein
VRRTLVIALAVAAAAVLAPAAAAPAADVRLWACHGPDGAPLPFGYSSGASFEASLSEQAGGCRAAGGFLRLRFTRPDPGEGHNVFVRFPAGSPGLVLRRVELGRRASGPGYWARTSAAALERENNGVALDGVVRRSAGGTFVELGLRCDFPPRCDASTAAVDFRFATLTLEDKSPPTVNIAGLRNPAGGVMQLRVTASDGGAGLASVRAAVDGATVASTGFAGWACRELSPFDGTIDLALAQDCAPQGTVSLDIDTTVLTDAAHRLTVSVTDAAGNASSSDFDVTVRNELPADPPAPPPAPRPVPPTPAPPAGPPATPTSAPSTRALVSIPRRLAVSRRGRLALRVLCPAVATAPCRQLLTLTAGGRTLARGSGTAAPGRRVRITLRLSAGARRTLARRGTLRATLTLAGATPAAVRLRQ